MDSERRLNPLKLFVGNIRPGVEYWDLMDAFKPWRPVHCHVVKQHRSDSMAFIEFRSREEVTMSKQLYDMNTHKILCIVVDGWVGGWVVGWAAGTFVLLGQRASMLLCSNGCDVWATGLHPIELQ